MEADMAMKDTLDGLLAGVTRGLFSPRTAYSTSSRKLWRLGKPLPLTHQRTQSMRIANMHREPLNVADRRQAEWGAGLETFEEKRS
jgi:hypothetical protein